MPGKNEDTDKRHQAQLRLAAINVGLARKLKWQQGQYRERIRELDAAKALAKRYRDRCHVTAEDVEAAGVSLVQVLQWCEAHPTWVVTHEPMHAWVRHVHDEEDGYDPRGCNQVALLINASAGDDERPALDILDEMAAMEPTP